jgi:riboflavin kinase/FMN adenylyltransferase
MSEAFETGDQHHSLHEGTGGVAAMGNFDGVHAGHRAVIATASELASSLSAPLVAAVFKPHPRRYFRPDTAPFRLMSDAQRVRALKEAGCARIYAIAFGPDLAAMSPEDFARDVIAGELKLDGVVTGPDFRFGKGRAGTADDLKALGERHGFTAATAPEFTAQAAGGKVSSTAIREALIAGDPVRAASMLGRPWAVEGLVARGDQRGRTLGFPTANISLGEYQRPKFGVYAVRAQIEGEKRLIPGVANIGRRPTVDGTDERVEAHLFDFSGDLYGRTVEVRVERFIRAERRFDGLDALKAQIGKDSEAARALLG